MRIFGVSIDNLNREDVLRRVEIFLNEPRFHRIATVNPEFLLLARENEQFKESLLTSDVRLADGVGVVLAGLFFGEKIVRFPGADLVEEILRITNEKKLSLYLAIRKDGLSSFQEIKTVLLRRYPNIEIGGADMDIRSLESKILNPKSELILCNFGAPDQELFLESIRNNPGNMRLAVGVGGSFDYMTGKLWRAPRWMQFIGLEWLWRGILQPHRLKRIWNAVVIFPFYVLTQK